MLTDKDFEKLHRLFDLKLEPIKEDIDAIKETVQATAVAIDAQISVNQDFRMEFAAIGSQLNRHDGWIKQLAKKTETKLED